MNYRYLLARGETAMPQSMRETDLHVRLRMLKRQDPLIALGKTAPGVLH